MPDGRSVCLSVSRLPAPEHLFRCLEVIGAPLRGWAYLGTDCCEGPSAGTAVTGAFQCPLERLGTQSALALIDFCN